jgi:bifunctional non-homologous end joining protein LigD
MRKLSLVERKAALKKIITGSDVQFGESFEINGREIFEHGSA